MKRKEIKERDDVTALMLAVTGLKNSTSRQMLRANINFLTDYFLIHPSKELPDHLKETSKIERWNDILKSAHCLDQGILG